MDDDTSLSGRTAGAIANVAQRAGKLTLRGLLYSPKDLVAGLLAVAGISAIVANTMFLQTGRHPAPMYSGASVEVTAPVNPLPRPRPVELAAKPSEAKPAEIRTPEPKPVENKIIEPASRVAKPVSPPMATSSIARPPAPIPVSTRHDPLGDLITTSRRVASVQRALTEYGYGQLKPTGTIGADTQAAIQRFERERKIPVTGQMSDRLVRELSAAIGRPID